MKNYNKILLVAAIFFSAGIIGAAFNYDPEKLKESLEKQKNQKQNEEAKENEISK